MANHPLAEKFPEIGRYAGELSKIPLESTGVRKAIDYGFTPVQQVAKDVRSGIGNLVEASPRTRYLNTPVTQVAGDVKAVAGRVGKVLNTPVGDLFDRFRRPSYGPIAKVSHILEDRREFQGLPIAVENVPGSVRKGVTETGKRWKTIMQLPYGYIEDTKGADGEEIDAYVGPDETADTAYVVHQKNPNTGEYDEDKVMLGFSSKRDAKESFLAHYDDPEFLGPISPVPMDKLKRLVAAKKRLVKIAADTTQTLQNISKGVIA
jgi:hypothetical protein